MMAYKLAQYVITESEYSAIEYETMEDAIAAALPEMTAHPEKAIHVIKVEEGE